MACDEALDKTEPERGDESSMGQRLKVALEWGIVWGVKLLTVLLIVAFGMSWFVRDYATLRSQAGNGQQAFQFLMQQQQDAAQATSGIDIIKEPDDAEAR